MHPCRIRGTKQARSVSSYFCQHNQLVKDPATAAPARSSRQQLDARATHIISFTCAFFGFSGTAAQLIFGMQYTPAATSVVSRVDRCE